MKCILCGNKHETIGEAHTCAADTAIAMRAENERLVAQIDGKGGWRELCKGHEQARHKSERKAAAYKEALLEISAYTKDSHSQPVLIARAALK